MKDLAQQVMMSAPAAAERVRRLEEAGVIIGYGAKLDPEKLGLLVHGYIITELPSPERRHDFYRFVQSCPELPRCEMVVTSGKEAILSVYCRDATHLMQLQERICEFAPCTTHLCTALPFKDEPIGPGREGPSGSTAQQELIRALLGEDLPRPKRR